MTNKQMETRIKNLEQNLMALANKVYKNDTANENKISKVDVDLTSTSTTVDDHDSILLDLQYQLILTQICGDIDTSIFDEPEEE